METAQLKKFAQHARRSLMDQVSGKLKQVLAKDSPARREAPKAVADLEKQIAESSAEQVIEKVAYIWFNRFCALRFMDVNEYNTIGVVSPATGQSQPEILAEAKAGHIDESLLDAKTREQLFDLLSGKAPSRDAQGEAYRLLIVAVCNNYNKIMPYLFEVIADYTELLMPDDLLSESSILAHTREAMTAETCESVEVVGWLYQFYISEKKDEVFADLKKNKKITPENIPAATQLFTPHWIVRYLVENSVGRLWMLNHPNSKVAQQMDYYIKPVDVETDFLKINSPEELKICDPACGSGHMLTYAYDLLYAIYLDAGFDAAEIPEKILTHNLYGIEIDERAAELAAFALTMKAVKGNPNDDSNNRRKFFRNPIKPNICQLHKIHFTDDELNNYIEFIGRDLFTADLRTTLKQFEEADNFGSLIRPALTNVTDVLATLEAKDVSGQLFLTETHKNVLKVLHQTEYLVPKYHVVIANPPYMGGKGMNGRLAVWLKDNYPDVKSDLFSAFMVRNTEMTLPKGQLGFMSPFVWMFISSYEKLRDFLINKKTITSLVQLEYSGFDGATVPICTFTIENYHRPQFHGGYVRLSDFRGSENQAPKTLEAIGNHKCGWFYRARPIDFKKITGSPIAYWVSSKLRGVFDEGMSLKEIGDTRQGMATSDNSRFVRVWSEVSFDKACVAAKTRDDAIKSRKKWFPYNKGGDFRKWYGNSDFFVNWDNDGKELLDYASSLYGSPTRTIKSISEYFKPCISWSKISSANLAMRFYPDGYLFDVAGCCIFSQSNIDLMFLLGYSNTIMVRKLLATISPTLNFEAGQIATLPIKKNDRKKFIEYPTELVNIAKLDWDSYERSWDFSSLPLLKIECRDMLLEKAYSDTYKNWKVATLKMKKLEEDNNRIFIEAYGLQDELTPEVPLKDVTLTCNPHYRYGGDKTEEELEALLLADTMREFISYAVGCMFGRYSLDKEGLVLANQGETLQDYLKQVPKPSFMPDEDNVIPLIDFEGDWFEDDLSERFKEFLRTTFGDDNYAENLQFIEEAIGKDIKKFFTKDFYTDHIKRYKKRPIYWMFSSPKGSFNALIYMHRYRPDTASVVLNDYLREFRAKLSARKDNLDQISISVSAEPKAKTKALKDIETIKKVLDEVNEYEREILYPLATKQIPIDLDDGVKVNYLKFGDALKKIAGLASKDEE